MAADLVAAFGSVASFVASCFAGDDKVTGIVPCFIHRGGTARAANRTDRRRLSPTILSRHTETPGNAKEIVAQVRSRIWNTPSRLGCVQLADLSSDTCVDGASFQVVEGRAMWSVKGRALKTIGKAAAKQGFTA